MNAEMETFSPPFAMKWHEYKKMRPSKWSVSHCELSLEKGLKTKLLFPDLDIGADALIHIAYEQNGSIVREIIKCDALAFTVRNTLSGVTELKRVVEDMKGVFGIVYQRKVEGSYDQADIVGIISKVAKKAKILTYKENLLDDKSTPDGMVFVKVEKGNTLYFYDNWGTYRESKENEASQRVAGIFNRQFEKEHLRVLVDG